MSMGRTDKRVWSLWYGSHRVKCHHLLCPISLPSCTDAKLEISAFKSKLFSSFLRDVIKLGPPHTHFNDPSAIVLWRLFDCQLELISESKNQNVLTPTFFNFSDKCSQFPALVFPRDFPHSKVDVFFGFALYAPAFIKATFLLYLALINM